MKEFLHRVVLIRGFKIEDLKKRMHTMFGPDSPYDNPLVDEYTWKGEISAQYPVKSSWRHFGVKHFLKKYENGDIRTGHPNDKQMDCVAKIPAMVAMYSGKPEMLTNVEIIIRVTEDNDLAVAIGLAAARVMEHYVLHGPDPESIQKIIANLFREDRTNPQDLDSAIIDLLHQVLESRFVPHYEAVNDHFINTCDIPKAFQSAVHGVLKATDFQGGIRQTIAASGCNCSRASFIGACIGAMYGAQVIPAKWKNKTLKYQESLEMAETISHPQM